MIIHKIRCKNFKSFRKETEIDFTQLQGLYKISGRIGSGKTTIGEMIIFALFGSISGKNNGDLISWGEKHGLVEVWYACRGHDVYIRRELNSYGQSPVYVEVDGAQLDFTDKRDIQSQLERNYMDTTRTIMELLCVISFNSFTSLSSLNTKQTKEFLNYVFNFDVLSNYVDACGEQIRTIKKSIAGNDAKLSVYNKQLERLQNYIEGDPDDVQAKIKTLESHITEHKLKADLNIGTAKNELQKLYTRLGEVKTAGSNKKKEIDLIKKGKCPTCGAPIDASGLEEKEQERKLLLESYNNINTQISAKNTHISQLEYDLHTYISEKEKLIRAHENELYRLREQQRLSSAESDAIKQHIDELSENNKVLEVDKAEYEQLSSILSNDVKQFILGSFIPSLNTNISEIAGILNMQFVPEFDINFKCSVKRGETQIPTSSLSTGQLKLVDMVIILAVLRSIMMKVSANIIFLDELFSNLDAATRTELVGVLRYILPKDATVLIVSHQDIDNDLFDGQMRLALVDGDNNQKQTNIIYS